MTVLDSSRWHRIDRALERLLDGKHVDLEAFPPEDRALLDQLLRSARGDLPGLDTPAVTHQALGAALADMLAEQDGIDADARVGPFRIVEQIGAGGMGIVYLARRVDGGFEQRVALKVLADAAPDDAALRLFERERQLLARLEHPGIARLIDGGVTASGRPWFAMEYIDGEPLIDYVEKRALGITGRIHLFLQACDALDHAHRQLILHRDIKPGNLLVTSDGVLKLVDFGLGALLRTERAGQHTDTTLAAGRMTPGYASPEQARGEPVGVASDVFQLGLVLYRLISGCRPYRVDGLSAYQIALAVSDPSIRPPGARWREPDAGQRAIAFGEPAARLYRRLAGDL
ncbi:MAG: serine/threonine-protein kinase, partial [Wenzhouxiangellaceae bacterium]